MRRIKTVTVNYHSKLLYNQTWEDPRADLHALKLNGDCRVVAIASAGCNLLNYLIADCGKIEGVDINAAHLEVAKLRIAAMKYLPDYASFFRFFGEANTPENINAYDHYLLPQLDPEAKSFWQKKDLLGRRRIDYFRRAFYQQGLCGQSFRSQAILARLFGRVYERMLACTTLQEQEDCFDREIEPGYRLPFLGALCENALVFIPVGIPPAQLERVRQEDSRPMLDIIQQRVRRLGCDFDIGDNYFAWQAIAQRYDTEKGHALPDYLKSEHYAKISSRLDRISLHHASMTIFLQKQPDKSIDRYVLLDAQDWMNGVELNYLWSEIVRTARHGARVIFRTLGSKSPLEYVDVDAKLTCHFRYDTELSLHCWRMDRAAVYGGFHLYVFEA